MKRFQFALAMLMLSGLLTACGLSPIDHAPCTSNEDCGIGASCQAGQCIVSQSNEVDPNTNQRPQPTSCQSDADCSEGRACDSERNVCRKTCQSDADCTNGTCDATTKMCKRNRRAPQPCSSDNDCNEGQVCDSVKAVCQRPPCEQDADCLDGKQCHPERKICYMPCQSDNDCSEGLVCNKRSNSCRKPRNRSGD